MTRLRLRLHAGFITQLYATGWFKTLQTHTTHMNVGLPVFIYTYIFVWLTLESSTDKTQLMANANHARASHAKKKVLRASALSSLHSWRADL
jgi:hypothetical protein